MKFKHQNIIITVLLALLFLTACSKTDSNKTANLPTAKTILTKAEKDNFNSMHASWNESANQKTQQKAEAQYTKKPTIIYANVSSNSNHYQMWIEGKNNYIKMKGTNSQHWFKTKLSKTSAYGAITDSLNGSLLKKAASSVLFNCTEVSARFRFLSIAMPSCKTNSSSKISRRRATDNAWLSAGK